MTLAERINRIVKEWDPDGYEDRGYSIELLSNLLEHNPKILIEDLVDYMDAMLDAID